MADSERYSIESTLSNLKNLFRETCDCVHSVKFHNKEHTPYTPTYFMYMFCFFNTLYNINWKQSIDSGNLSLYKGKTETEKQKELIEFCFSDDKFWPGYVNPFIKTLQQSYTSQEIKDAMYGITNDKYSNGNFYSSTGEEVKEIRNFKRNIQDLLENKNFDDYKISSLITFIYHVRCNIFHGVKCLDELGDIGQRTRFEIYGNILMAINEMTVTIPNKTYFAVVRFLLPLQPQIVL